ncbi:PQQ-dependent sugar dehydrogenase [Modestobacter sp. VKM Ac-2985]|uniref:PQQ-dependent sugar dehydrogenase n=1 Tax=Modestobacter sp. VKM Ac-2985 TaxID=3004139 RepID=UPI0022ABC2F4|nr:PQQ-dependent sugar dehydrogenase [Modestobacter sp. VKM Ac-2985]MCZ2836414.1 PQQ-dependent sugar dehydrogenase [Modestobacter sp. VKM Ac-2985]
MDAERSGAEPRWSARWARSSGRALLVLVLLVAGTLAGLPGRAAAATLPPGFVVLDLPSGQDEALTDFAFAPDGSWFTTGKNGRVAWVSADGRPRTLAELPVVTVQDLGLTGLAVPADYATSRRIFTARTLLVDDRWTMRLSSWAVTGAPEPTGLADERVIWDLETWADVHTMTALVPDPDGSLWVSIGDAADFRYVDERALVALDVDDGRGKVLHVLPDGRGVASNPYYDPADPYSWRSRVYASGFRSPFRMSLDPTSGAPVLGDVGWYTWEEVDLVRPGASYGWPCWEGESPTPGYADLAACQGVTQSSPLYTYEHGPAGTSISGGIVYTGESYPEAYRGAYFFGDYASGRVYTLRYDAQGDLVRAPETDGFGVDNGLPVAFQAGPNGDVVYADIGGSVLKRLVYVPGNRAPTASATLSTDPATGTVTFDGTASSDLDGEELTHDWEFGDGTRATGARVVHTYPPGEGTYTARLTVTDPLGATGTRTMQVVPSNGAPVVSLTAPPADRLFAVGETVSATATATDREDGALPVTWSVVLVHCSGGYCHDHPGESSTGGSFSRPFDDHGDQTQVQIVASAQDSSGVRVQQTFVAEPRLRTLTVEASTPSAITVNGVARASVPITAGATVSVIAPTVATDGVATFERWSDGAARARTLTMPDQDLVLGADYLTPIGRRYATDPRVRAVLGSPLSPEAGDAELRHQVYSGGRMYWSPRAGAHEVHGAVLGTYLAEGGALRHGEPLTDELTAPDGIGRYNHFAGGTSVYWSPATGAHQVGGAIRGVWSGMGWERSIHGYPRGSERSTPNGRGRYNDFQDGGVYWLPGVGARSVHGAIYLTWARFGWEAGRLGFPITDENGTPDGVGRYNHFEGGSVYWTPGTGAQQVEGAIRARWAALGWETSYLGYPTSDEYPVPGGRRSDFQGGSITWDAATGRVTESRG